MRFLFYQINVPNSLMHLLKTKIYPFIFQELKENENENSDSILFISRTPQCIISFTGWILEYRVIYVLEKTSESSLDSNHEESLFDSQNIMMNCLRNQELKLYRIFLKKNMDDDEESGEEIQR